MRAELEALIQSVVDLQLPGMPPIPDLNNDCTRYFLLMLATSIGLSSHRAPKAPLELDADHYPRRSARLAERLPAPVVSVETLRLQSQWIPINREHARVAAAWTAHLTSEWRRAVAQEREWEPAARAGAKLVGIVTAHHRRLIRIRRRALQTNAEFLRRRRDPEFPVGAVIADPVSA